ncbi:MAG: preprotein translocase subunit YajC [Holosporaceae bacterium]|jgi:preprotein translocase subunit YajC|nr:preprotein translocase subunit YajC [Holosporaceae bacterium]
MANTQSTSTPTPPSAGTTGGLIGSMTPILLMVLAFYFLILRPQQKRDAKSRELVNSLKKNDKVVTGSGIIGVVHKVVGDQELSLEISEGVRVRMMKSSVVRVLGKDSSDNEDGAKKKRKEIRPGGVSE